MVFVPVSIIERFLNNCSYSLKLFLIAQNIERTLKLHVQTCINYYCFQRTFSNRYNTIPHNKHTMRIIIKYTQSFEQIQLIVSKQKIIIRKAWFTAGSLPALLFLHSLWDKKNLSGLMRSKAFQMCLNTLKI